MKKALADISIAKFKVASFAHNLKDTTNDYTYGLLRCPKTIPKDKYTSAAAYIPSIYGNGWEGLSLVPQHFDGKHIIIIKNLNEILNETHNIGDIVKKLELPTLNEILTLFDDDVTSADLNGLNEEEILAKFNMVDLTSMLTKLLLQNEYLKAIIKDIIGESESEEQQPVIESSGSLLDEAVYSKEINKPNVAYTFSSSSQTRSVKQRPSNKKEDVGMNFISGVEDVAYKWELNAQLQEIKKSHD